MSALISSLRSPVTAVLPFNTPILKLLPLEFDPKFELVSKAINPAAKL